LQPVASAVVVVARGQRRLYGVGCAIDQGSQAWKFAVGYRAALAGLGDGLSCIGGDLGVQLGRGFVRGVLVHGGLPEKCSDDQRRQDQD
jgi:hypothetical protein